MLRLKISAVCIGLCLLSALHGASGVELSTVASLDKTISELVYQAASTTLDAVMRQMGMSDLSLLDIPLSSLELRVSRRHQVAVEIEGREYAVTVNHDDDPGQEGGQQPGQQGATPAAAHEALGGGGAGGKRLPHTALAQFDPQQWAPQQVALPEITLAGPVELVLPQPTSVALWLPHSADAGRVRRLLVGPGATIRLSALKGMSLRRPIPLPQLPASYLAEVVASAALGQPEPGFENAPGLYYLAQQLFRQATNASLPAEQPAAGGGQWLLSFNLETAGPAMTLVAAAPHPALPAPRLKAKRLRDGTLQVTLRAAGRGRGSGGGSSGAAQTEAGAGVRGAGAPAPAPADAAGGCDADAGPGECSLAGAPWPAATAGRQPGSGVVPHRLWAWPLPVPDMGAWLPYEKLLRSIITSHPFDLGKLAKQGGGLPLRLTRSSVQGVRLLHFDMHLRGRALAEGMREAAHLVDPNLAAIDDGTGDGDSLQVWEAVVEVKPRAKGGGFDFTPVSAKRKHAYHSTLTLSPAAVAQLTGREGSLPLGFESQDQGVARRAAAAAGEQ